MLSVIIRFEDKKGCPLYMKLPMKLDMFEKQGQVTRMLARINQHF